jgi:deferrochelatase/peroxidase EfeB
VVEQRPTITRRRLLAATGTFGVGAAGIGAAIAVERSGDAGKEVGKDAEKEAFISFEGTFQSGIVTPRSEHGIVAAFDVTATDREQLVELFRALTATVRELMAGHVTDVADPLVPPADNMILGPRIEPDALTVTIAVGASLFDDRYGLRDRKPSHLDRMPAFPNDDLQPGWVHGDIAVQICAGHHDSCAHALRRLVRTGARSLALRWMLPGFIRPDTTEHGRTSARNLLGFKDGTANLDPGDADAMRDFVWVRSGDGEPSWATNGTYMVVRVIRNKVEFWDRSARQTQELVLGRSKESGAPLDGHDERDLPRYADDPEGTITPLNAHIRLANPRTAASSRSLILRRSFNYSRGFTETGVIDQGLLFVCFQRDLSGGFVAVQTRLNGEALEQYVEPIGGGYYFVLPGVTDAAGWLGERLLV